VISEALAQRIFAQAIHEDRAAELLECLFDGGSATVDAITGKLVLISLPDVTSLREGK